jgi:hypothetical protein
MKKLLISLSLLLTCFNVFAQNKTTDSSATCVAYWKNGEQKVYLINRTREKYEGNELKSKFDYTCEAHIHIKDSTKEGYTIEWVNKNYQSPTGDPNIKAMNVLYKGLKFLYKTDETGAFKELVNWEDVRDFYINLAAFSIPKNNDTAREAFNKTKAMFQSREVVEASLIKEVQLLHIPYGYEFSTTGQNAQTTLPNVFGGNPIPAIQTIRISELKPGTGSFQIAMTQEIDKLNATSFVKDIIKMFGTPDPKTSEEIDSVLSNFEITDTRAFTVQVNSGWMSKVVYKQMAKADAMKQTETYTIVEKK